MRAYFFGNMYLSSIQQGIQALHVVSNMFVKYEKLTNNPQRDSLFDWAENHKTVILLNAGFSSTIRDLSLFFMDRDNTYAWDAFTEGQDALDGALTCVGIVLPEKIYESAKTLRETFVGSEDQEKVLKTLSEWEIDLIKRLNTFGMAK